VRSCSSRSCSGWRPCSCRWRSASPAGSSSGAGRSRRRSRRLGLLALLLSLTSLLALSFGTVRIEGEPVRAGGAVGEALTATLTASFDRTGTYILVSTSLFLALILSTQFSFAPSSPPWAESAARAWRPCERLGPLPRERRKERMRREVIRKHIEKDRDAGSTPAPRARTARVASGRTRARRRSTRRRTSLPRASQASHPEAAAVRHGRGRPCPPPRSRAERPPKATAEPAEKAPASPSRSVNGFVLPPPSILDEIKTEGAVDKTRLFERAKVLQSKCAEFGVNATVVEIHPGRSSRRTR